MFNTEAYVVNALKKIYRAVFKIYQKSAQVMLRKSLVLEIKKTQINKTFLASKFHFFFFISFIYFSNP